MSVLADPRAFRRTVAGLSLVVAPLLYVVAVVADPALRQGGDTVGVYGRYPEQVSVSASLLHWSWVLLLPGIVGMVHLIRGRGVVFGHIAGGLAFFGVVNFSGLMLGDFFYSYLERALPAAQGAALADQAITDPGARYAFQIPGFVGLVGLLLLGLALAYARRGPWWAPFAMLAGILTGPIFPFGTIAGGALYIAGAGVIGLRILRMSDEEWSGEPVQPTPTGSPSGNLANTR
ncbi:hypothetical protein ABZ470_23250 [Streptosporangium sp. NPDC020072]|uniref:hypothetical protein n=1 Tax=unclassified Streptosporangium TaxID=2632669 RepID=UPI003321B274